MTMNTRGEDSGSSSGSCVGAEPIDEHTKRNLDLEHYITMKENLNHSSKAHKTSFGSHTML